MEPVIEMKQLMMSYGSQAVLRGVNLKVYPGQIIGYIGANGAGKSTTVKIVLGLIEQYYGEVTIFGRDIRAGVEYKGRIGYVPEAGDVYDCLSGQEYLTFVGDLYGVAPEVVARRAARLTQLLGLADSYRARISTYSKGMRQKLLIIASLIHNPDILFWDEPISGLDANSVMIVKEVMAGLAHQGKTIFYSSHIMEVVEKLSDRIVLLHNGVIAADGPIAELRGAGVDKSLHDIFNKLTGFRGHKEVADEIISLLVT